MRKIFLLFVFIFNCQLKLDLKIDLASKKANIILYNESQEYIAIPVDTVSLRPYFENICIDISEYEYPYPTLALSMGIMEEVNENKYLQAYSTSALPSDKLKFKNYIENTTKKKTIFINKVKKWQKENKLGTYDLAKINYYINKNFILLNPYDKVKFVISFNPDNITNDFYKYSFYNLETNKKYFLSVILDIDNCVYKFLTEEQKQKLKKYKLFSGTVESNKIKIMQ